MNTTARILRRFVSYFAEQSANRPQNGREGGCFRRSDSTSNFNSRVGLDPANPVLIYEQFEVSIADNPRRYVLHPEGERTVRFEQALSRLGSLGRKLAPADTTLIREARHALCVELVRQRSASSTRPLWESLSGIYTLISEPDFLNVVHVTSWRAALKAEPLTARRLISPSVPVDLGNELGHAFDYVERRRPRAKLVASALDAIFIRLILGS